MGKPAGAEGCTSLPHGSWLLTPLHCKCQRVVAQCIPMDQLTMGRRSGDHPQETSLPSRMAPALCHADGHLQPDYTPPEHNLPLAHRPAGCGGACAAAFITQGCTAATARGMSRPHGEGDSPTAAQTAATARGCSRCLLWALGCHQETDYGGEKQDGPLECGSHLPDHQERDKHKSETGCGAHKNVLTVLIRDKKRCRSLLAQSVWG